MLQMVDETKARIAAYEATEPDFSTRVSFAEDDEMRISNEIRRFEHQVAVLNVDEERCKVHDSADKGVITDANAQLEKMKEALCALEELASADSLITLSVVEDRNSAQEQFATTSTKL